MTTIDSKAPILVTGATGYVAGWLVKTLVEKGHTVHAAVRDPNNKAKLRHLSELSAKGPGIVRFFKADLLDNGSYAEAMKGCELVFHTASPFTSNVTDPVKELIEPAQLGTRNVLEEANRCPTVKRVVVTSSCAAIYGDNADLAETPNGVFTEEVWNTSSSVEHQAYSYSKMLAEREAWEIAKNNRGGTSSLPAKNEARDGSDLVSLGVCGADIVLTRVRRVDGADAGQGPTGSFGLRRQNRSKLAPRPGPTPTTAHLFDSSTTR